ncbi:E3 ubiquitin-protein ligase CCNB1IP1-like [Amphiura filiformis]|uniref:E3 ubiquitin-protein ligase CCNB1IP1-like n=1 Tax=Amphiura filiformis TaxID=82378 RepID=UPI003B2230AF
MEDLLCNVRKCRKSLRTYAWITSCSHIFCDEDGTKEFKKSLSCPACGTNLAGKFDVIRIDLSPSEQYKSMVLAGLKPETIIEVCSRAISFWVYQTHQEHLYQEYASTKAKEKFTQLEQYYDQVLGKTQAELTSVKNQLAAMKKDLESTKKRQRDDADKLVERNRQYQKLQLMYDALRRKTMIVGNVGMMEQPKGGDSRMNSSFDLPISVSGSSLGSSSSRQRGPGGDAARLSFHSHNSPPQRDFVLRPSGGILHTTPHIHLEQDAAVVQSRFNMELGTPNEITKRLGHRRL